MPRFSATLLLIYNLPWLIQFQFVLLKANEGEIFSYNIELIYVLFHVYIKFHKVSLIQYFRIRNFATDIFLSRHMVEVNNKNQTTFIRFAILPPLLPHCKIDGLKKVLLLQLRYDSASKILMSKINMTNGIWRRVVVSPVLSQQLKQWFIIVSYTVYFYLLCCKSAKFFLPLFLFSVFIAFFFPLKAKR